MTDTISEERLREILTEPFLPSALEIRAMVRELRSARTTQAEPVAVKPLVKDLCAIHAELLAQVETRRHNQFRYLDPSQFSRWCDAILDAAIAIERSALNPQPVAVREVTPEMVAAALPHLHATESAVRPIGQFWPGMTADESEEANWKYFGHDRVRAALVAALQEPKP